MTDITIHIDEVAGTENLSVEVNDHKQQKSFLLDNTYTSYDRCIEAAMTYIKLIRKDDKKNNE